MHTWEAVKVTGLAVGTLAAARYAQRGEAEKHEGEEPTHPRSD